MRDAAQLAHAEAAAMLSPAMATPPSSTTKSLPSLTSTTTPKMPATPVHFHVSAAQPASLDIGSVTPLSPVTAPAPTSFHSAGGRLVRSCSPPRPTTVGAVNIEFSTASSDASTTAANSGSQ